MFTIRIESITDIPTVRSLNELAFGQSEEADIVDRLRKSCDNILSLVAVKDDEIVGHIFFSPTTVNGDCGVIIGMGLCADGCFAGTSAPGYWFISGQAWPGIS